jgi:hypothetical protein
MTNWEIAMAALVPFIRQWTIARVFVAMALASGATYFTHDPLAWIVIDGLAAAIVMARPAALPQRLIGAAFVVMMCFSLGYYLSPQVDGGTVYNWMNALGWFQWLILAGWISHGIWRKMDGRYRHAGSDLLVIEPGRS